ncbi:MAG TPA: hypothetical protein VNJ71_01475 [Gemmatimonadales bacterium]|nr:hypothetical protein [Gemmatimonadales bacterium]
MKQRSPSKGVDHYGVVDTGNRLGYGWRPVVIHQTPPAIRVDWLEGTGVWLVLGKVLDEPGAIARIQASLQHRTYDLFGHNCEHFARFVTTGTRESHQLQAVVAFAGILTFIVLGARGRAA